MSARRAQSLAALVVGLLTLVVAAPGAIAALREVSVGNYYFEDDAVRDRTRLDAQQGDQLRFTIREAAYPPHSVNVDELNIHSGDLLLFDTYTTPPLNRPGVYRLYCRVHTDRGHITKLYVHAAPATTTTTRPRATTTSTIAAGVGGTTSSSTSTTAGAGAVTTPPAPSPDATDAQTPSSLAPVGVGTATDRRRAEPAPGSLAAMLGRPPAEAGPWTRAVRLGAAVSALLLMTTVLALAWAYRPRAD